MYVYIYICIQMYVLRTYIRTWSKFTYVYICIWIWLYVLRTYSYCIWRVISPILQSQVRESHVTVRESYVTVYCIWRVISPISSLNQFSSSLGLFCHVPFKRDQLDWDWRIWWNGTPHAMGCTCAYRVNTNSYICIRTCVSHMHVCVLVCACQ